MSSPAMEEDGTAEPPTLDEKVRVDVGIALTKDVITGAGVSCRPRELSFFAESTCPSLDIARRVDFIEYFLETTRASIHTHVSGVKISFTADGREETEALLRLLKERAINVLAVDPIESMVHRTVDCNLPELAASWSAAVRRRARAAIATACGSAAQGVPQRPP